MHMVSAEPLGSRHTLSPGNPTSKVQVFPCLIKDVSTYSQVSLLIQALLSFWKSSMVTRITDLPDSPASGSFDLPSANDPHLTFLWLSLISHHSSSHVHPRVLQSCHSELFPLLKLKLKHFAHCNLPAAIISTS